MKIHNQAILGKRVERAYIEGLNEIRRYLNSSKFGVDVMVNKNDIILRLQELQSNVDQVKDNFNGL